eukprot:gb/GECG01001858.1/.p1 GENE.gb/GECG01001858.1/~~gb/GECG01001858.1/.p1  ORF type:complete len:3443 (+),score=338.48 gb/GECG01001858.1/:1-10329(+)
MSLSEAYTSEGASSPAARNSLLLSRWPALTFFECRNSGGMGLHITEKETGGTSFLDDKRGFSVSVWLMLDSLALSDSPAEVYKVYGPNISCSLSLYHEDTPGTYTLALYSSHPDFRRPVKASAPIKLQEWFHLSVVHSVPVLKKAKTHLYVNGVEVANAELPLKVAFNSVVFASGLDGAMAHPMLYNGCLTPNHINLLHRRGVNFASLLHSYRSTLPWRWSTEVRRVGLVPATTSLDGQQGHISHEDNSAGVPAVALYVSPVDSLPDSSSGTEEDHNSPDRRQQEASIWSSLGKGYLSFTEMTALSSVSAVATFRRISFGSRTPKSSLPVVKKIPLESSMTLVEATRDYHDAFLRDQKDTGEEIASPSYLKHQPLFRSLPSKMKDATKAFWPNSISFVFWELLRLQQEGTGTIAGDNGLRIRGIIDRVHGILRLVAWLLQYSPEFAEQFYALQGVSFLSLTLRRVDSRALTTETLNVCLYFLQITWDMYPLAASAVRDIIFDIRLWSRADSTVWLEWLQQAVQWLETEPRLAALSNLSPSLALQAMRRRMGSVVQEIHTLNSLWKPEQTDTTDDVTALKNISQNVVSLMRRLLRLLLQSCVPHELGYLMAFLMTESSATDARFSPEEFHSVASPLFHSRNVSRMENVLKELFACIRLMVSSSGPISQLATSLAISDILRHSAYGPIFASAAYVLEGFRSCLIYSSMTGVPTPSQQGNNERVCRILQAIHGKHQLLCIELNVALVQFQRTCLLAKHRAAFSSPPKIDLPQVPFDWTDLRQRLSVELKDFPTLSRVARLTWPNGDRAVRFYVVWQVLSTLFHHARVLGMNIETGNSLSVVDACSSVIQKFSNSEKSISSVESFGSLSCPLGRVTAGCVEMPVVINEDANANNDDVDLSIEDIDGVVEGADGISHTKGPTLQLISDPEPSLEKFHCLYVDGVNSGSGLLYEYGSDIAALRALAILDSLSSMDRETYTRAHSYAALVAKFRRYLPKGGNTAVWCRLYASMMMSALYPLDIQEGNLVTGACRLNRESVPFLRNIIGSCILRSFSSKCSDQAPTVTWESRVRYEHVGVDMSSSISASDWNMLKQAFAHQNVAHQSFAASTPGDMPSFDIGSKVSNARMEGQTCTTVDSHLLYSGLYLISTVLHNTSLESFTAAEEVLEQCVLEPLLVAHALLTDSHVNSSSLNSQATDDISLINWIQRLEPMIVLKEEAGHSHDSIIHSISHVSVQLLSGLCLNELATKENGHLLFAELCSYYISERISNWPARLATIVTGIMDMVFKRRDKLPNRFRVNWNQTLAFLCRMMPSEAFSTVSSKLISVMKLLRNGANKNSEGTAFSPIEMLMGFLPSLRIIVDYWSNYDDSRCSDGEIFELLDFVQSIVHTDCWAADRHSVDTEASQMDNDALEVQSLIFDHINQALRSVDPRDTGLMRDSSESGQSPQGASELSRSHSYVNKESVSIEDCLMAVMAILKTVLNKSERIENRGAHNEPSPQDMSVAIIGSIINGYNFGPLDDKVDAFRDEHYLYGAQGSPQSSSFYHEEKRKRGIALLSALTEDLDVVVTRSMHLSLASCCFSLSLVPTRGTIACEFSENVGASFPEMIRFFNVPSDVDSREGETPPPRERLNELLSSATVQPSALEAELVCLVSTSQLTEILYQANLSNITTTGNDSGVAAQNSLSSVNMLRFCLSVQDRLQLCASAQKLYTQDRLLYNHAEALLWSLQRFRRLNAVSAKSTSEALHNFISGTDTAPCCASAISGDPSVSDILSDCPCIETYRGPAPESDSTQVMFKIDSHDIPVGGAGLACVGTGFAARTTPQSIVAGSGVWGHRTRMLKSSRQRVQARNYKQHGAFRASQRTDTTDLEDILKNAKVDQTDEDVPETAFEEDAEDDLVRTTRSERVEASPEDESVVEATSENTAPEVSSQRSQSISSAPSERSALSTTKSLDRAMLPAHKTTNAFSIMHQAPYEKYECSLIKITGSTKGEFCFFRQDTMVWRPYSEESDTDEAVVRSSRAKMWSVREIAGIWHRHYKLEPRALEIDLVLHTRTRRKRYFFAFGSKHVRDKVIKKCLNTLPVSQSPTATVTAALASPVPYQPVSSTAQDVLLESGILQRWKQRRISNFDYLLALNSIAGRSYNDITQYPVFPWTICDFVSDRPNFANPNTYRDLRKPVGALSQERLKETWSRFKALGGSVDMPFGKHVAAIQKKEGYSYMPPFMYGSHYCTPVGAVVHYLLRLSPFTESHVAYQDQHFDVADRLFYSIASTWNLTTTSISEVKELIPEFYNCSSFLINWSRYDFGKSQTGEYVDHVNLPPWAWTYDPTREGFAQVDCRPPSKEAATMDDHIAAAKNFVDIFRMSLENEYVSSRLHHWVDLIFGYKQRGPSAVMAHNVYFYLTYSGAVDFEHIEDDAMRQALEQQIEQYGQCPIQLLNSRHPPKDFPSTESKLPHTLINDLRFGRDVAEACDPSITESRGRERKQDTPRPARCSHLFVAPTYKHKLLHVSVLEGISFWRPLATLPMEDLMRYRTASSTAASPNASLDDWPHRMDDKIYGFSIGDVVSVGSAKPTSSAMIFSDGISDIRDIVLQYQDANANAPAPLAFPLGFRLQARFASTGANGESMAVWVPLPPAKYVALGCMVTLLPPEKASRAAEAGDAVEDLSSQALKEFTGGLTAPTLDSVVCVHESLVNSAEPSMRAHAPLSHCYLSVHKDSDSGKQSKARQMHVNSLWSVDSPFATFVVPDLQSYFKELEKYGDNVQRFEAYNETSDYREWYSYCLANEMSYTLDLSKFNQPFKAKENQLGMENFGPFKSPWLHDTARAQGMRDIAYTQAVPNGQGRCICVDSSLNLATLGLTVLYGSSENEKNFVPVSPLPDIPWKRWLSRPEAEEEAYIHDETVENYAIRQGIENKLAFCQQLTWSLLCKTLKQVAKSSIESEQLERLRLICNTSHADELLKWSSCPPEIAFPPTGNLYMSAEGSVRSIFDNSVPTDLSLKVESVSSQDEEVRNDVPSDFCVSFSPRANIMATNAGGSTGIRVLAIDPYDGTATAGMDICPVNSKVTALTIVDDGSFIAAGFADGGVQIWPILSLHDGFGSLSAKDKRSESQDSGRVRSRRSVSTGLLSTVSLSQPMAPTRPHMEYPPPSRGSKVTRVSVSAKYDAVVVGYVGEAWLYELGRSRPLKCWKWADQQLGGVEHCASQVKCVSAEFVCKNAVVLVWDGFAPSSTGSPEDGYAISYISREDIDQRVTSSPLKWKHPHSHGKAIKAKNRSHHASITCTNVLDSNPSETGTCDASPFSGPSEGSYGHGPSETLAIGDSQGNVVLLDALKLQPLVHFFTNSPVCSISKSDSRGYFFVGCSQGCVSAFALPGIENVASKKNAGIIAFEKVSTQVQRHAASLGYSAVATKDRAESAAHSTKQFASEFRSTLKGVFSNVFGKKKKPTSEG